MSFKFDIVETVNTMILEQEPREYDPKTITFWPSEASAYRIYPRIGKKLVGKGCARKLWYRSRNVPSSDPISARGMHRAKLGDKVEDYQMELFAKAGRLVERQTRITDSEFNISGKLDGIVKDDFGNNVIVEMKSYYGYDAGKLIKGHRDKKTGFVLGRPKDEHLLQALLYIYIARKNNYKLKLATGEIIQVEPYVKLFYEARDDADLTQFDISIHNLNNRNLVAINGELDMMLDVDSLFDRFVYYRKVLSEDAPPPRDHKLVYTDEQVAMLHSIGLISDTALKKHESGEKPCGDWTCAYCDYRTECYKK